MKTRVVKVSRGWVPQVYKETGETKGRLWWRKPIYAWYGIDRWGLTYRDTTTQLRECLASTEEDALLWIEEYKKYKEHKEASVYDTIYLSSN